MCSSRLPAWPPGSPEHMTTYVCPEFAATGIELKIIELQVQREAAQTHGIADDLTAIDAEISQLWSELADLVEQHPNALPPLNA